MLVLTVGLVSSVLRVQVGVRRPSLGYPQSALSLCRFQRLIDLPRLLLSALPAHRIIAGDRGRRLAEIDVVIAEFGGAECRFDTMMSVVGVCAPGHRPACEGTVVLSVVITITVSVVVVVPAAMLTSSPIADTPLLHTGGVTGGGTTIVLGFAIVMVRSRMTTRVKSAIDQPIPGTGSRKQSVV